MPADKSMQDSSPKPAALQVTIKIREVLEWDLPQLTLDLARKVSKSNDIKSVDEFHGKVREAVRSDASTELQVRATLRHKSALCSPQKELAMNLAYVVIIRRVRYRTRARVVQARIQSEILRRLADITTVRQVPQRSFEAFGRTRYEREITEMVQAGQIPQEDIEGLTTQAAVEEHMVRNRAQLLGEFRTVVALDEIFKREGLEVDEELVAEQARATLADAKKSGATGATVCFCGSARVSHDIAMAHVWAPAVLVEADRVGACALRGVVSRTPAQALGLCMQLSGAVEYVRNEAMSFSTMAFLQQHAKLVIKPLDKS